MPIFYRQYVADTIYRFGPIGQALVMANGKTSVIALFPASKPYNHIIRKRQSLIPPRQRANKKRYPSPNPNLKLNSKSKS